MGDLGEPIAGAAEVRLFSSPAANPNPASIGAERWARAEASTQKIICKVQPTAVSEERRRDVIDYVQRLIRGYLGCEVFPYGSVPLKTYLPDGDIDLTAFVGATVEDALVNDLVSLLESEEQNSTAEFIVKDVQLIRAEVKIVKCIVQNIVVDISFNQLGGLCTLCFLEQVNRLIGKDHIFKRSIILIKAWCYYESRILGAHHALISTYALETLVLYIFHLFHSKLGGPLEVLYRFLDYFSKFDWDTYCISLNGPVRISSLPEIVGEEPGNGECDLLLSDEFLRYCVDMFSVPSRGVDTNSRTFIQKHLNIVDPLKANNNLGRSVSKGNFFRIRSAFTYGARKLGRILLLPEDNITDELSKIFSNTLDRHGSGQRPDVQDPVPMSGRSGSFHTFSFSETGPYEAISRTRSASSVATNGVCKWDDDVSSQSGGRNGEIMGTIGRVVNGNEKGSTKVVNPRMPSERDCFVNGGADIVHRLSGDAEDLASSKLKSLKISNTTPKALPPSGNEVVPQQGTVPYAPHLYFSESKSGNGKLVDGNSNRKELNNSSFSEGTGNCVRHGWEENVSVCTHEVLSTVRTKDAASVTNSVTCHEHPLPDLNGDYDSHLNSLQYGRFCYEHSSGMPALTVVQPMPFQFSNQWDVIRHSYPYNRNGFSNVNANVGIPRPGFYPNNTVLIPSTPGTTFRGEDLPKQRGTGTYIPNANRPPYRKPFMGRGMNQGPVRSPRYNSHTSPPMEVKFLQRNGHEHSHAQFPDQVNGIGGFSQVYESGSPGQINEISGFSHVCESGSPGQKIHSNINGLHVQAEGVAELAPVVPLSLAMLSPESKRQQNPASLVDHHTSAQNFPAPGSQMSKPAMPSNKDRLMAKSSYRLKDEDDFPPLSM